MVMKNKLFILVLFLLIGSKVFSQINTLNVYLEKNQGHRTGVDLIFENNSNDTILLFTKFHNLSLGGEIPPISGIDIEYFSDNQSFNFNWGELPPLFFVFSKGRTLIYPKSKVKLLFNVGEYFKFPEKSSNKYEVSFFMNYIFGNYHSTQLPTAINFFRTNRVTIVEPTERLEE
jgi:hypothetical protein